MRDTIGLKKKNSEFRITATPNPATSIVNLRLQIQDSRFKIKIFQSSNLPIFQSSISIKIYDISGKYKGEKIGEDLNAGVYFIKPNPKSKIQNPKNAILRVVKVR